MLLIDQDPQGSLGKNFWGKDSVTRLPPHQTAAAIYEGPHLLEQVIHESTLPGIHIIPANDSLEDFDYKPSDSDPRRFLLRDFLKKVEHDYDMVLIDTPPNAGSLLAVSAWTASDCSLTVIQPTKNSVEAIADVKARIAKIIATTNPDLVDLGCVFTNVRKNRIHRLFENTVRQLYGDKVLETTIPSRTIFEQATAARKPVTHYRPNSDIARRFPELLREIGEAIAEHRGVYQAEANQ